MTELKKCLTARKLTRTELEESRNTTAKIIKKLHGGLISERAECVELHTTLRRLATLLENSQFTKEEKTALHQCLLNVDGKEEFFLEPIAIDENPPLTLDELQKINDDMENRPWVWIEVLPERSKYSSVHIESAYYQAHSDYTEGEAFYCGYPGLGFHFEYEEYGKTWLAYRRKPEEVQE